MIYHSLTHRLALGCGNSSLLAFSDLFPLAQLVVFLISALTCFTLIF